MGFGLPSAVGAKVAAPEKIVVDIDGDASFSMTAMELATASQFDIGVKVIVLSDRASGPERVPVSALVACGAVHHHLVKNKQRAKVALMVETAEAREVHHVCVLVGYGADAVCPYLMLEVIMKIARERL